MEAVELKATYVGKKVLVTGHTGFKGSWLIAILHLLGAETHGYALNAEKESHYNDIDANMFCTSNIADIRDYNTLKEKITAIQPDFIFHLAAQPLVLPSYDDPLYTYETNVMGTANLLESIKELNKPCTTIIITTDKVYHNNEWLYPYRENDKLGGYDPYSSSKACTEILVNSFRSSFFNPNNYSTHQKSIATARAGNVIGGGDWADFRIIPDIIKALNNNKPITLRNPNAVRPWQHVLEALNGYLLLGKKLTSNPKDPQFCSAWNFGPLLDENVSVKDITEKAIDVWGNGAYKDISTDIQKKHEAGLLRLDSSKAVNTLGWKPKMNANEAVSFTINWYKEVVKNKQNPKEITFKQLNEFFDLLN